MSEIQPALDYAKNNKDAALEDLKAILRIASISTLPEHEGDIKHAAEWLSGKLQDLGFDAIEIMPTAKHPIVYGEWLKAGPDSPPPFSYMVITTSSPWIRSMNGRANLSSLKSGGITSMPAALQI